MVNLTGLIRYWARMPYSFLFNATQCYVERELKNKILNDWEELAQAITKNYI